MSNHPSRRRLRLGILVPLLAVAALTGGCGSDEDDTSSAPACGLVDRALVDQALSDLPDTLSDGVGLVREDDSIRVDPDDARGAQCTQAAASDSGNVLDIRVTQPSRATVDERRAEASAPDAELKETCEPLETDGAVGSICLVDGRSKPVVHVYSIWSSRIITIDLSRTTGPRSGDRELAASIAQSVDEHLQ